MKFQLHLIVTEQLLILFDQCILRFSQNAYQGWLIEIMQCRYHREAPDKFWNKAKVAQIFRSRLLEYIRVRFLTLIGSRNAMESYPRVLRVHPSVENSVKSGKSPAGDEEYVARIQ